MKRILPLAFLAVAVAAASETLQTQSPGVTSGVAATLGPVTAQSNSATTTATVIKALNNAGSELFRVQQDGKVGVGATNPGALLQVGSGTDSASTSFQIGTSTMVVLGSGNVGLGTTNPAQKLHLEESGAQLPILQLSGTGNASASSLGRASAVFAGGAAYDLGIKSASGKGVWIGHGATPVIVSSGSGNVGIGTTNPGAILEVNADLDPTILVQSDNDAGDDAVLKLEPGGSSGGDPYINFSVASVGAWFMGLDNDDSDKFKISRTNFATTNFVMTTAGSVGIGDSAPSALLSVKGGALVQVPATYTLADDSAGTKPALTLDVSSGTAHVACNDATGCDITFGESAAVQGQHLTLVHTGTGGAMVVADVTNVLKVPGASISIAADQWAEFYYTGTIWLGSATNASD